MKTNKKGFVEIPQTTLNALKNMLFSQDEKGVDLSSIVDDLTPNEETRDLTAINVALTYKGVKVQIDERPHYTYEWKREFVKYSYVGYSLILGIVKVRRTSCKLMDDGTIQEFFTNAEIQCLGFDQWSEMTTDVNEILAKIEERTKQ